MLGNDTDPDDDNLTVSAAAAPAHGTVSIEGSGAYVVYTPTAGYAGPDVFGYTVTDGFGGFTNAQVNLTVGSQFAVGLPWTLLAGAGNHSTWLATNDGGTNNGLPQGGNCSDQGAINIYDASVGAQGDNFDSGLLVWVGSQVITSTSQVTVTARSLETTPMTASGLRASLRYYGLPQSDTLSTLASFYNPSGIPINTTVTFASNLGSDLATGVRATSSGDLAFTAADRWLVTSDSAVDPAYNIVTHVLYGPGPVAVPASSVSTTVFDCYTTVGVLARYSLSVPAGATRRLLFFNQLHETNSAGIADAAAFSGPLTPLLLAGLSAAERAQVVNWVMPNELFLPLLAR